MVQWLSSNKNTLFYTILGLLGMVYSHRTDQLDVFVFVLFGVFGVLLFLPLFNKTVNIYWVLLFFAPLSVKISVGSGINISGPTELLSLLFVFIVCVKIGFGWRFDLKLIKHPLFILLALDLGWTIVSAIGSELPDVSMKRVLLKIIFFLSFYFIFGALVKSKDFYKLYLLYGLGLIPPVLYSLYRHSQYGFSQATSFEVGKPFFDDHTLFAACMSFVTPFFILKTFNTSKKNVWWILSIVTILVFAIGVSYSRAAWISLIVAMVFYILIQFKIKFGVILIFIGIITVGISYNFVQIYTELSENEVKYDDNISNHLGSVTNLQNDASNLERINRWVCAYRMFGDRPIIGFGPGTYQFVYDEYQTAEYMTRISTHNGDKGNAHSEYFTYLSENGLPGLVIFSLTLLYAIYLGLKLLYLNPEKSDRIVILSALLGLITFYVHGLFNTFSDFEKMSILYFGSLAILTKIDMEQKKGA